MSILTPFFNLIKPAKNDPTAIAQINANMDTIDTEMHRPPLTVNGIEPNSTTRNLEITTVPLADNLTTEEAQINTGTYVLRTSGGEASIADGSAWLSSLQGNQVKTGYVAESLEMSVTLADPTTEDPISASLDRDTFIEEVTSSQTITLTYSNAWDADPATYGITVTGTPVAGDKITVVYVKENRGTITTATPSSFISTGWNLYNHTAGYARVVDYSTEYGFMISGTYTALAFAETLSGEQTTITPVDGYFTIPAGASDGYVFVTGGNATDTEIWMTWSDWTEQANGGTFAAYTQTTIDLSGVMVDFPDGLMRIGNYYDEINLNTQLAYSRVQKLQYTEENLAGVIASGVPYDTDANYIYAVRVAPVTYSISLSGEYTCSDHGMEMFIGTSVPVTASSLYGNDLKGKLRRDVLTISQQTLTAAQQAQVLNNIGGNINLGALSGNSKSAFLIAAMEAFISKGITFIPCTVYANWSGGHGRYIITAVNASNASAIFSYATEDDVGSGSYTVSGNVLSLNSLNEQMATKTEITYTMNTTNATENNVHGYEKNGICVLTMDFTLSAGASGNIEIMTIDSAFRHADNNDVRSTMYAASDGSARGCYFSKNGKITLFGAVASTRYRGELVWMV